MKFDLPIVFLPAQRHLFRPSQSKTKGAVSSGSLFCEVNGHPKLIAIIQHHIDPVLADAGATVRRRYWSIADALIFAPKNSFTPKMNKPAILNTGDNIKN